MNEWKESLGKWVEGGKWTLRDKEIHWMEEVIYQKQCNLDYEITWMNKNL